MSERELQVHDVFCPERYIDYLKDGCDYCAVLTATRRDEREKHPTYHDDGTMQKVWSALFAVGLTSEQVTDAVNGMQNSGIYFREATRDGDS